MKRILSLLLCLVMVLSFAAPAAQASGSDDIYVSDGNLDDIIVGDNVTLDNVVVNGETVTPPVTDPTEPDTSPVYVETESTVPEEFENVVPNGEASVVFEGATVSAEGIPQGGSVTVENSAVDADAAIENFVAEIQETSSTELFAWDISVQDAAGTDWQPSDTVQMELTVPGTKLHKYSKVYVLHISDDGQCETIPATVSEDGTISFETTGFSTFVGFTVDFEFEGVEFSINGMESILLSDLMDQLKMPLYVEDVANVEFTDYELISVEKQGDDWLLQSLKAFDTTEALTITMNDGNVYEVTVTDATFSIANRVWHVYSDYWGVGINHVYDSSYGASFANNVTNSTADYVSTRTAYFQNGADHTITLQPGQEKATLYIDMFEQFQISGGSSLTIQVDPNYTGACKEIVFISDKPNYALFYVINGSLTLKGTENTRIVIGGSSSGVMSQAIVYLDSSATSFTAEYVDFQHSNCRGIDVRANELSSLSLTECKFENTVHSTQKGGYGGGAIRIAWTTNLTNTGYMVEVKNMSLTDCYFDGNTANDDGGAIQVLGYLAEATLTRCTFDGNEADEIDSTGAQRGAYGGAISFDGPIGKAVLTDCSFISCRAYTRGGAVYFGSRANKNGNYSRIQTVEFSKCSFSDCVSRSSHGGAIGVEANIHTIKVLGCSFSGCKCLGNGAGISIDSKQLPTNFRQTGGPNWTVCFDETKYGSVNDFYYTWGTTPYTAVNTVLIDKADDGTLTTFSECQASTSGGALEIGDKGYVTDADVNNTTITACRAGSNGSAVFLSSPVVETLDFENVTVKDCRFIMGVKGGTGDKVHPSTGFKLDDDGQYVDDPTNPNAQLVDTANASGTIRTTGATTSVLTMKNCTVTDNYSYSNGAGLYWNACYDRGIIDECKATVINCTFSGNYAENYGGGIYCESMLIVSGCKVFNNYAKVYGGGIAQQGYSNAGRMLRAGEQTNMTINNYTDENGKVITTEIYNNYTDGSGGGISIRANPTVSIKVPAAGQSIVKHAVIFNLEGAYIYNNTAKENGGGVSFLDVRDMAGYVDCDDAGNALNWTDEYSIQVNNAEVDSYTKSITITDGTIYNNRAGIAQDWNNDKAETNNSGNGGGVYMSSSKNTTLKINSGHIYNNSAQKGNGGGIYMTGKEATCTITGGTIGGINGTTKLSNHAIRADSVGGDGGGIAISGGSKIEMKLAEGKTEGGTISYNVADHDGGGVWLDADDEITGRNTITIDVGSITYNTAGSCGGGVSMKYHSVANLNGGTVSHNTAATHGGGLEVYYYANLTVSGGTISYNTATNGYGGGVCAQWYGATEIKKGSTITRNKAPKGDGGGIFIYRYNMTVTGGEISYNEAKNGGGVCSVSEASDNYLTTISGGTIKFNTASNHGGGLYNEASKVTVNGGTISQNTAVGNGGGIYLRNGSTATISGTEDGSVVGKVTRNTASNGGGVCVATGADLTVRNGFVTYNNAVGMPTSLKTAYKEHANLAGTGGAIYVADGSSAADRSTFTLEGKIVAIYGNLADFAADDVFANGNNTKLTVPQVKDMDLTEYSFKPEAWFEDYPTNDEKYTLGMNLGKDDGITNGKVYRYRGASSGYRFQLSEAVVTNTVNVEDTYICMTLGIPAAIDDTVVVDWGLPVQINVIDNDVMLTLDEIKQTGVLSSVAPEVENIEKIFQVNDIIYGGLDENWTDGTVTLNNLTHGTANLDKTTGLVNYRMYTTDMTMDTEDTFYYAVYHKTPNPEEGDAPGYYYYAKVQVIPATTIYFEDNFGAVKYEGPWNNPGNSNPSDLANAQDQDREGESDDPLLDADSLYGYDSLYSGEVGHSLGSCKSIQVSENVSGTATFTFTGTGFDIISHSNNNTGMIMVSIYEGDKVDDSKLATTLMVDTFYGCTTECYKVTYTYKKGTWVRTDERITPDKMGKTEAQPKNPTEGQTYVAYTAKLIPVTDGSADTLWQVPVIKADMNGITKANGTAYGYGTYTVEIYVAWAWWVEQGRPNYESCNFYLDAIRIYDPANNGVNSDTIRDAYLADKECWPTYQELRNMFITQERLSDKPTSGIVFMDGTSSYSVNAYQYFGPNNEVYLAPNESIAFKLDELNYINKKFTCEGFTDIEVAAVHIGMRTLTFIETPAGEVITGKVSVSVPVSGTGYSNSKSYELGSNDMYYDISHGKNKVVTIKNTGTTIIAITTAKVTHTGNSGGTDYADASELFTVDTTTALTALAMLYNKTEAPTLSPKYPTLSFEGEVFYNVYFAAEDLGSLTAANLGLVTFNSKDTEGTVDTAADVIYGAQTSGDLYVVSTNGIAAKNLGDDLYFKVFAQLEDGSYVYSDIYSYSAAQYAAGVLADSNATDSQKALVVAMLNYGAAAQTFFGHNTDALMNSALTAEQQALVSGFSASDLNAVGTVDAAKVGSFAANGGFTRKYPTVSFEGAFSINYYFVPENAVDGDMTFYYWTEDTYNTATELTAENADGVTAMTLVDGAYTAVSPELAAKELDKTIYVAATYECDGVTYSSGVLAYSLAGYCQQHAADPASNMQAFATAAAIYGCAAKEFFAV